MLHAILVVFAMYGITFAIKEASLLDKPRNYLARNSMFFYEMLSCAYCTGFHAGWIAYLLFNPLNVFSIREMVLWAFSSAAVSFTFNGIVTNLYKESP